MPSVSSPTAQSLSDHGWGSWWIDFGAKEPASSSQPVAQCSSIGTTSTICASQSCHSSVSRAENICGRHASTPPDVIADLPDMAAMLEGLDQAHLPTENREQTRVNLRGQWLQGRQLGLHIADIRQRYQSSHWSRTAGRF